MHISKIGAISRYASQEKIGILIVHIMHNTRRTLLLNSHAHEVSKPNGFATVFSGTGSNSTRSYRSAHFHPVRTSGSLSLAAPSR